MPTDPEPNVAGIVMPSQRRSSVDPDSYNLNPAALRGRISQMLSENLKAQGRNGSR